jgi:hypothetical protein
MSALRLAAYCATMDAYSPTVPSHQHCRGSRTWWRPRRNRTRWSSLVLAGCAAVVTAHAARVGLMMAAANRPQLARTYAAIVPAALRHRNLAQVPSQWPFAMSRRDTSFAERCNDLPVRESARSAGAVGARGADGSDPDLPPVAPVGIHMQTVPVRNSGRPHR